MFKGANFHETYTVTYRIKFDVCYFSICLPNHTYIRCAHTRMLNVTRLSMVRGYHVYCDVWNATRGDRLS